MKTVKFTCINRHQISLIQAAFVGSSAVFVLPFPITAVSNFFSVVSLCFKTSTGEMQKPNTRPHTHITSKLVLQNLHFTHIDKMTYLKDNDKTSN